MLMAAPRLIRARATARRLWRDCSGLALLEFAFTLPIVLTLGLYGAETANLALVNMKVSQIALNLADNASRVGNSVGLTKQEMREVDVNDVLQAARYQGAGINLTTNGRITLSSLENIQQSYDTTPTQRIHWQRCLGLKSGTGYDSTYTTTTTAGTTNSSANAGRLQPGGMGDTPTTMVSAPPGSGVMFVEINYYYQPLVGSWLASPSRIRYVASFIVRDNREFSFLRNPTPVATRATCNLYTS